MTLLSRSTASRQQVQKHHPGAGIGMNHWPACHVCKTAYISAVNRMRCESCTDPKHQHRDPGHGLYQPCLIPGMTECGKWTQLKRWWDDLPRPEAVKLLQGSTRFGHFYLQLERDILEQLLAAGCSDVDTLARNSLVLQSTPDKAPSATYVVAAGKLASRQLVHQGPTAVHQVGLRKDVCRAGNRGCKLDM